MKKVVYLKKKGIIFFLVLFTLINPNGSYGQIQKQMKWEKLPQIPDEEGFAGMFAGVSDEALICIGGSNFPGKKPWEGGIKKWYDHIYILEKNASSWKLADEKIPHPLAYGVSFTYKDNIIIVGGSDDKRHYSDVFTLSYQNGVLKTDTLTSLPFPLANMTGALVGDILFIAGGSTKPDGPPGKYFLALNLAENAVDPHWVALESWPGPERIQAVSASLKGAFFLFSGIQMPVKPESTTERIILTDAYKCSPQYNGSELTGGKWVKLSAMPRGVAAGPSPAPTIGSDHILFPGGLDGVTAKHQDPASFPGFVTGLLAYHAGSDSWLNFGDLPKADTRVTVPVAKWGRKWVIPNGEKGPGKRSPKVFALSKKLLLGWIIGQ